MSPSIVKSFKALLLLAILLNMSPSFSAPVVYKFGVVPQFSEQRIQKIWQPILKELENRTGFKFQLTGSSTIPAFEKQFMTAEFDFAYMNPYHVILAAEANQYKPMLRDVGNSLFGILVVRKDSNIKDASNLNGESVAFPAPNALSASLIPRSDLDKIFHVAVKPRYVQSHSSVYLNVALGRVSAGGGVQKTFDRQDNTIKEKLRVIYKTKKFSPHPIVVRNGIPKEHAEKIKQAFLDMGQTSEGKALLKRIPISEIGGATIEDYLPLKELNLDQYYSKD